MTPAKFPLQNKPLLWRLRRLGWVMIGDQGLADHALSEVLETQKVDDVSNLTFNPDSQLLKAIFQNYDQASSGRSRVRLLKNATAYLPEVTQEILHLTHVQRVAVALIAVEDMATSAAARLSGRPESVLLDALTSAINILGHKSELYPRRQNMEA